MKTTGMKILIIGLIVLLPMTILDLYTIYYQFNTYVIQDEYLSEEELKSLVTVDLFTEVFFVIGILIAVIGMLMILKDTQKQVESKPSQ